MISLSFALVQVPTFQLHNNTDNIKQCTNKTFRTPGVEEQVHVFVLESSTPIPDTYALGDCADVEEECLSTTAEIVYQKAKYLAEMFNRGFKKEFKYEQKTIVVYLGWSEGVVSRKKDYSGRQAWITQKSKSFVDEDVEPESTNYHQIIIRFS